MAQIFTRLLRESQITVLESGATEPDLLIVPPNGALLDTYQYPGLLREQLMREADLPLVIFPSSSRFTSMDPASIFGTRKSPVLWMLREPYSFHHLRTKWAGSLERANVTLVLDHDVVASGHHYVPEVFAGCAPDVFHPLLVARLGAEASVLPDTLPTLKRHRRMFVRAYQYLPDGRVKLALRRRITRSRQILANRQLLEVPGLSTAEQEALAARVGIARDISDPQLTTRSEYLESIAGASLVLTNRLHVALPAAALGKETLLVDSGYHKLRGVYEHSLSSVPNIKLLSRG